MGKTFRYAWGTSHKEISDKFTIGDSTRIYNFEHSYGGSEIFTIGEMLEAFTKVFLSNQLPSFEDYAKYAIVLHMATNHINDSIDLENEAPFFGYEHY